MQNTFEIGQRVKYNLTTKLRTSEIKGVVLEDKGDVVELITHFVDYKPHNQVVTVEKELLTKY